MGYAEALEKSWGDLAKLKPANNLSVKFLADDYSVDVQAKRVLSLACNIQAKEFVTILILHYLAKKLQGLPEPIGEWLTFRELSGVEGYYDAFRKRSLEPLIRKYGKNTDALKDVSSRLPAKLAEGGDIGIVVQAFENIPVLVKLWKQDAEFGADANMYFDRSIKDIFCTEDIVVLAGFVSASL